MANEQEMFQAAAKAISDYDVAKAEATAKQALGSGVDPVALLEKGFIASSTRAVKRR